VQVARTTAKPQQIRTWVTPYSICHQEVVLAVVQVISSRFIDSQKRSSWII